MKEIKFIFDEDKDIDDTIIFESNIFAEQEIENIEDIKNTEDIEDTDDEEDEEQTDNSEAETDVEYISERIIKKPVPKRKAKRRDLKKMLLAPAIAVLVIVAVLASPLFAVRNIEMNELSYFTKEDICDKIGLSVGDNGIFFNEKRAVRKLESDIYISAADISFQMPDTMRIVINENKICGYLSYLGSYLYIDREGRVIEIKSETAENLPIIEGLKFTSFTRGEVIPVENSEAFEAALIISGSMSKYDMLDKAVSINVTDTDNIYAYIDNIKVLLGNTIRMEEKIKTMAEAAAEIPDGDRGTLDLQDLSKPIIFKYTT